MSQDIVDELLNSASGGKPASFKEAGTTYEGELISMSKKQLDDFTTKKPETWPNGEPKLTFVIVLQTDQFADDDHDGRWAVYCRSGLHTALVDAMRECGATSWDRLKGARVKVQFWKTMPGRGNDRKVYRMRIEPKTAKPEKQDDATVVMDDGSEIPF